MEGHDICSNGYKAFQQTIPIATRKVDSTQTHRKRGGMWVASIEALVSSHANSLVGTTVVSFGVVVDFKSLHLLHSCVSFNLVASSAGSSSVAPPASNSNAGKGHGQSVVRTSKITK